MMNANIIEFYGFDAHWETDHSETVMAKVIGAAHYCVRYPDGSKEDLVTGLRPGENNAWNVKVIESAQAWIDSGGIIPEYLPPTPEELRTFMQPLTACQLRLGLINADLTFAQVDSAIAAIADETERTAAQIEWEFSTEFRRTQPFIVSILATIGLTPEEVDDLWAGALNS